MVEAMDRLGFDVTASQQFDDVIAVTRRRDGLRIRVRTSAMAIDNPVDVILRSFRDYDASTSTPDHWMAL